MWVDFLLTLKEGYIPDSIWFRKMCSFSYKCNQDTFPKWELEKNTTNTLYLIRLSTKIEEMPVCYTFFILLILIHYLKVYFQRQFWKSKIIISELKRKPSLDRTNIEFLISRNSEMTHRVNLWTDAKNYRWRW